MFPCISNVLQFPTNFFRILVRICIKKNSSARWIKPLLVNAPSLYPLKTSEHQKFLVWEYKIEILARSVNDRKIDKCWSN